MAGNVHVVPAGADRWAVTIEGTDGTGPLYRSQADAIASGTVAAQQAGVDLIIHEPSGVVRERIRFRQDGDVRPL